jgi:hypothetical protein
MTAARLALHSGLKLEPDNRYLQFLDRKENEIRKEASLRP